jgi:hypothetical protein
MTLLSLITATILLSCITAKWGVLPSISASYYKLKKEGRGDWFFFGMIAFSTPLLYDCDSVYLAASVGSLWFVGVAGAYDDAKMINRVHYTAAGLAIFFAMIHIWLAGLWCMVVLFLIASVIIVIFAKNRVWWVEIAALLTIYLT